MEAKFIFCNFCAPPCHTVILLMDPPPKKLSSIVIFWGNPPPFGDDVIFAQPLMATSANEDLEMSGTN